MCAFCASGNENLCPRARWTGKDVNGGYAEFLVVPAAFAYPLPERSTDAQAAPLLCAGVVGYRALRLAGVQSGDNISAACNCAAFICACGRLLKTSSASSVTRTLLRW